MIAIVAMSCTSSSAIIVANFILVKLRICKGLDYAKPGRARAGVTSPEYIIKIIEIQKNLPAFQHSKMNDWCRLVCVTERKAKRNKISNETRKAKNLVEENKNLKQRVVDIEQCYCQAIRSIRPTIPSFEGNVTPVSDLFASGRYGSVRLSRIIYGASCG